MYICICMYVCNYLVFNKIRLCFPSVWFGFGFRLSIQLYEIIPFKGSRCSVFFV